MNAFLTRVLKKYLYLKEYIDIVLLVQSSGWWEWLSKLANDVQQTVLESITSMIKTGLFGRLPFLLAGFIVIILFWCCPKRSRSFF